MRYAAVGILTTIAILTLLGALASWSPIGWLTLLLLALVAVTLLARTRRARRGLTIAVVALCMTIVGLRTVGAHGRVSMLTLPSGKQSRWATQIVDEQDASVLGARLFGATSQLPPDEQRELVPATHDAYVEMRRDLGITPSPLLDTLLTRQSASAFDVVVIEPRDMPKPRAGVIFLHGYAGSFTIECWLVARAADAIGAVTVCPATDFSGHWSSRQGVRAFGETLRYLRARGIDRVYLAGLSNGAVGASAPVAHFASSLRGLILISGTPASGNAGLPTLVVQGDDDTMVSAANARAFAARTHATYASFAGGHFVLMLRRDEVRDTIAAWLRRQESS